MTSDAGGNEDLRCELFDLFASDEHQLAFMKEMRRVIVQVWNCFSFKTILYLTTTLNNHVNKSLINYLIIINVGN